MALTGRTRELPELIHEIKPWFALELELAQFLKPGFSENSTRGILFKSALTITCEAESSLSSDTA